MDLTHALALVDELLTLSAGHDIVPAAMVIDLALDLRAELGQLKPCPSPVPA